jgi:hypothetical protein
MLQAFIDLLREVFAYIDSFLLSAWGQTLAVLLGVASLVVRRLILGFVFFWVLKPLVRPLIPRKVRLRVWNKYKDYEEVYVLKLAVTSFEIKQEWRSMNRAKRFWLTATCVLIVVSASGVVLVFDLPMRRIPFLGPWIVREAAPFLMRYAVFRAFAVPIYWIWRIFLRAPREFTLKRLRRRWFTWKLDAAREDRREAQEYLRSHDHPGVQPPDSDPHR